MSQKALLLSTNMWMKNPALIFLSSVTLSGRTLYISLTLHYCVCVSVFLLCLASLAEGEAPEAPPPLLPNAVSKTLLKEAGSSLPNTYLSVVSTGCFDISCRNKSQPALSLFHSLLFLEFTELKSHKSSHLTKEQWSSENEGKYLTLMPTALPSPAH